MSVNKEKKLIKFDIMDYLDSEEAIAIYLEEAFTDDNFNYFIKALNNVVRARGINNLAKKMGVNRESLYKSFDGKTKPRFETVCKALQALGMKISIKPINETG